MYCIRCGNGRLVRGPCDGARGQTKATLKAFEVRRDDGRRWHNRFDIVHLFIAVVDVALGKQIFLVTGDKLCALSPYWTSKVYCTYILQMKARFIRPTFSLKKKRRRRRRPCRQAGENRTFFSSGSRSIVEERTTATATAEAPSN